MNCMMSLQEYGLVFISNDSVEDQEDKKTSKRRRKKKETEDQQKPALVTRDALQILGAVEGNLGKARLHLSDTYTHFCGYLKRRKAFVSNDNMFTKYSTMALGQIH